MKRNLELIRHILVERESSEDERMPVQSFTSDEYNETEISYHIKLLVDADYIVAKEISYVGAHFDDFWVMRLTNFGHDYLDSIRDDGVWTETKTKLKDFATSAPLDAIKQVATSILMLKLGL